MLLACALALASCSGGFSQDAVKIIDIELTDEEYAFVTKKGNTALVSALNDFLAQVKQDGTLEMLVAKYFEGKGERVGYKVSTGDVENTADKLVVATNCPFQPFEYLGTDGLIYGTTMIKIVVPQAVKNILPTLGNELIGLIKETSVLSFIAVYDLYKALIDVGMVKYDSTVPYLMMGLIYIVLVLIISAGIKLIERRFAKSDRN